MIVYNIKHRGPYEYEKFVLNFLQMANEVKYLREIFLEEDNAAIQLDSESIMNYYQELISEHGILNQLLNLKLEME